MVRKASEVPAFVSNYINLNVQRSHHVQFLFYMDNLITSWNIFNLPLKISETWPNIVYQKSALSDESNHKRNLSNNTP